MKKIFGEWKYLILALAGILLFGFLIRVYNLTILPVFADEAIYIRWSQVMVAEPTLRFLPLSDGKQPLFMWILMFLVRRFPDPLFIGRFLSVLAGLGTTLGIFVGSWILFKSKKVSLFASLMWAISPFAVFFDRMALVDASLGFFGIWTLTLGIITAKTKRLDAGLICGFFLGGAMLTKSPAIFFILMLPTTVLAASWPGNNKQRVLQLIKLAGLFLVTYVIAFGMYNVLRLGPNFQMIGARNQDYIFPLSHLWTNPRDPFIFLIDRVREWIWIMGPSVVAWLFLVGIAVNVKKRFKEILLLLIWFLFPVLVQSEFAKVFTARYIFFTIPAFLIIAASAFLSTNKWVKKFVMVVFLVFASHALFIDYKLLTDPSSAPLPSSERSGYLEEWTAGTGIKEVADYLKHTGGQIVVGTEGYFGTLPDGLQIYMEGIPNVVIIGVGVNINEVHTSLKESAAAGNKTYLVVNSSRMKIKPENYEKYGLRLIASYPKALRAQKNTHEYIWYGERDYLLFFEVAKL